MTPSSPNSGDCHDLVRDFSGPRPTIVSLCGSTRHPDAWQKTFYALQMAGTICLTAAFPPSDSDAVMDTGRKAVLDRLWRHHIDLADEVLVLNVGGYIGDSTRSEIDYAIERGKPVNYLEPRAEIERPAAQEAGAR